MTTVARVIGRAGWSRPRNAEVRSKRIKIVPVIALAVASFLSSAGDSAWADGISLPGTYKLIDASVNYLDTGEIIPDIFGKTPTGYIMYGTDGRMLTMITYNGRPKPESIAKTTDEQRLALYKTMQGMEEHTNLMAGRSCTMSTSAGMKCAAARPLNGTWNEMA